MEKEKFVKFKPPIILLGLLTVATCLHTWTALGDVYLMQSVRVGGFLMVLGVWIMALAQSAFKRVETTIIPAEKPSAFVTGGPYKWSRNPMYVAGALLTLGLALMAGTISYYVAWIVMFFILNSIHIPYEEQNMEQIFGEEYRAYKKRVRRWI